MNNRLLLKYCGKRRIAHNEGFLFFPQCVLLKQIIVSSFAHIFTIISFFEAELEEVKIGISGKELNHFIRLRGFH